MKRVRNIAISIAATLAISACASLTPKTEVTEGYRIFDIKGVKDGAALVSSVKEAMEHGVDGVSFTNQIPPSPLPDKPARFITYNPFGNSAMAAFAAIKSVKCDTAVFTGVSHDNFEGAENTTFFVCLIPYASGYNMDVYYTFSKVSGGLSTAALSRALAQALTGDSSQFIPRTVASLKDAVAKTGAAVKLIDSYPMQTTQGQTASK